MFALDQKRIPLTRVVKIWLKTKPRMSSEYQKNLYVILHFEDYVDGQFQKFFLDIPNHYNTEAEKYRAKHSTAIIDSKNLHSF